MTELYQGERAGTEFTSQTIITDGNLRQRDHRCRRVHGPSTFFCGLIDDVRIYNRAVKP